MVKPTLTGTAYTLSFEKLSPLDFERLCLWLVQREGYERAEHLGEAGGEEGRDVVAWKNGRRFVFQCKRVHAFTTANARKEIEKLRNLPAEELEEAEPLMRRALAIDEKSFGTEHPRVAIGLNNLAQLLQATNRLVEAEPLMRRHLVIFLEFTRRTGHEHPHLRAAFGNYQFLLQEMGKSEAEIKAAIKALVASPEQAIKAAPGGGAGT